MEILIEVGKKRKAGEYDQLSKKSGFEVHEKCSLNTLLSQVYETEEYSPPDKIFGRKIGTHS